MLTRRLFSCEQCYKMKGTGILSFLTPLSKGISSCLLYPFKDNSKWYAQTSVMLAHMYVHIFYTFTQHVYIYILFLYVLVYIYDLSVYTTWFIRRTLFTVSCFPPENILRDFSISGWTDCLRFLVKPQSCFACFWCCDLFCFVLFLTLANVLIAMKLVGQNKNNLSFHALWQHANPNSSYGLSSQNVWEYLSPTITPDISSTWQKSVCHVAFSMKRHSISQRLFEFL